MPLYLAAGGAAPPFSTQAFNAATKVLSGQYSDPSGGPLAGQTVNVYMAADTTFSTVVDSAVTGSDGTWSIDLSDNGLNWATNQSFAYRIIGRLFQGSAAYTLAYGTATFDGTQKFTKTGGLWTAPTGTLTISSGVITALTLTNAGTGFEPGKWQTVTTGLSTSGAVFRGEIQAKADGTLDIATFNFTGTGRNGDTLNAGSGYAGTSTPSVIFGRRVSKLLFACRFKLGAAANGDFLVQGGAALPVQFLTGFKARLRGANTLDNTAPAYAIDALETANLSSSAMQTLIFAWDGEQAAVADRLRVYLDDVNVTPTLTEATQLPQNAAGTTLGTINASPTVMASPSLFGPQSGTTTMSKLQAEMIYLAIGNSAVESSGSTVPNISLSDRRARFTAGLIGATAAGPTGRQPEVCMDGSDMRASTPLNRGTSGNYTLTGTLAA